jgi:hypothetical protein
MVIVLLFGFNWVGDLVSKFKLRGTRMSSIEKPLSIIFNSDKAKLPHA